MQLDRIQEKVYNMETKVEEIIKRLERIATWNLEILVKLDKMEEEKDGKK